MWSPDQRLDLEESIELLDRFTSEVNFNRAPCESCSLNVFEDFDEVIVGRMVASARRKLAKALEEMSKQNSS